MPHHFSRPLAACVCALALAACAAPSLTAQSRPADAASLLVGKWVACRENVAVTMSFIRGHSDDTVQLKIGGVYRYKNADCTGAAEMELSMDEMLQKANQGGLDIKSTNSLKITHLQPTADSLFVGSYSGYAQGEIRHDGQVQFFKQPQNGQFHIKADGSYLKWSDGLEFKRAK